MMLAISHSFKFQFELTPGIFIWLSAGQYQLSDYVFDVCWQLPGNSWVTPNSKGKRKISSSGDVGSNRAIDPIWCLLEFPVLGK